MIQDYSASLWRLVGAPTGTTRHHVGRVAAAASLLLAVPASAADFLFCVAPADEEPSDPDDCRDGTFLTFAAALEAAAGLPDVPPGERPHVEFRLLGGPEATPHSESIFVDNREQTIGRQVDVYFGSRLLCPSPDSPPGQAVIEVANGGQSNGLSNLSIDLSSDGPCPSERPGVLGWDGGVLGVGNGELVGWSGWAVASGLFGEPSHLLVTGTSLRSGTGFAIHAGGGLTLAGSEFVGNVLPAASNALGLLWLEPNGRGNTVQDVLFFANLVQSSQALIAGPLDSAERLALVGNGLADQSTLLTVGFSEWPYGPQTELEPGDERGLIDSVIVGNRRVMVPEDYEPQSWPERIGPTEPGAHCVGGSGIQDLGAQPHPFSSSSQGPPGALLRVDPGAAYPERGGFLIARTFFVDNDTGHAPLIETRVASGLSLQLLHNTFADNRGVPIVTVQSAGTDSELIVIRNLLDQSDTAPLTLTEQPTTLIVSMNTALEGPAWNTGLDPVLSPHTLQGPDLDGDQLEFISVGEVIDGDACEQFALVCQGADASTCQSWTDTVGALPCPLWGAALWVPRPSQVVPDWPWDTSFFGAEGGPADTPGATGWACGAARATLDRWSDMGDGDGFPDAVDCDNEDPDVVPRLPERNGIDTAECDPAGSNCWICPDGTQVDDDDSAGDDDDSAEAQPTPSPTPTSRTEVDPGCGSGGCGFAWGCASGETGTGLALLLLTPLVGRRRRRRSA